MTGGFGTNGAGGTIYNAAGTNSLGAFTIANTGSVSLSANIAYLNAAAGTTLNLTGAITQTSNSTSQNTISGGGIVSYSGSAFATGKFNVSGGTTFNTSGTLTTTVGTYTGVNDSVAGTTWNINAGSVINQNLGTTAPTTLFIGTSGGTGTVNMNGGTATFAALNIGNKFDGTNGDGNGTLSVNGGTLNINGAIKLGSAKSGVGTINLNTSGRLVITASAGQISRATGSSGTGGSGNINFNGGTLQYNATPATPAIAANITTTILEGGGTINTNGQAITIAGPILHGGTAAIDGGITKNGANTLTLSAANSFTGLLSITAGTVTAGANSALGTGSVTIAAGATLSLATGVTAAHADTLSTLTLTSATTSIVNLAGAAGTVQDTVGNLIIAGIVQAPGTYGATGSGAQFTSTDFTGTGFLLVTAVPEPSTYACVFVALVGLGVYARSCWARREA
ncbi:MAG: autotransporter-associated beta strand repeat-containing protein [Rhodospirillales bacterium]|nr:autotransporter-associated beta strand repeat-containing protein [Acetobacter sp.]